MSNDLIKCPKVEFFPESCSLSLSFDFREYLDVVVVLDFQVSAVNINILSNGVREDCLDAGLPIFNEDGTPIYFGKNFPTPKCFSYLYVSIISRFQYLQTALLKICAESVRGIQMLQSNPCLLWIVIDFANKNFFSVEQVHFLLGAKRKNILIDTVGSMPDGVEKFISKIVILTGEKSELDLIQRIILDKSMIEAYAHWSQIPIQALYISERYPVLCGAGYLLEWCSENKGRMSSYLSGITDLEKRVEDTISLGLALNIKSANKIVKACHTIMQLENLHDQWTETLNKSRKYYEPDIEFDRPIINEVEGVKWLSTANSLVDEGIEMNHCIATYVNKARRGLSIIFSVSVPERATVEIREGNGGYVLVELKRKNNLEVSEETKEKIQQWLRMENDRIFRESS